MVDELTGRELEILERLANGLTDRQIADELYLSLNTVKWYNRQIYSKLGVSSRSQAIARSRDLHHKQPPEHSDAAATRNLPLEINRFVGRSREKEEVGLQLRKNRLVTLAGPPGAGKTRLALQIARQEAAAFRDGVYFIPLAAVEDVDQILWATAEHLGFPFDAQAEPVDQLLGYLRQKSYLLVLDNFDHLIAGASVLTEILRAAPRVKILVTSRERLNLYGEVSYTLGGLGFEDQGPRSDAAELFIERAQSVIPDAAFTEDDLQHVQRICQLVDGLPLGIELAATWVDTLRLDEIAAEIEANIDFLAAERKDVPASQRSIRAAFDRSWERLEEGQKTAFQQLSVFHDGFSREAAAAAAGVDLRTLQALVYKSLVRHNPHSGRYVMHGLLRSYAAEKLEQSGRASDALRRHALYFAAFMEERWPWVKDRRQKQALQEMEADLENVRAAWRYWIAAGDVGQIRRFLHSFWVLYDIRGWYPAGMELFGQAARVMRSAEWAEAQAWLGWLQAAQGMFIMPVEDYEGKRENHHLPKWWEAHGMYNTIGAGPQRGFALAREGVQRLKDLGQTGEMLLIPLISLFLTASHLAEEETVSHQAAGECLQTALEIGDQWAIAKARQFLAVQAVEAGQYAEAERLAGQALAAFEENGDHWSASVVCIEVFGYLTIARQDYDAARSWIRRGLRAAEEIDFRYSIQTAYWQLGFVAALEEDYAEAGKYWRRALQVSDRMLGGRSFIGFGRSRGEGLART